MIAKLQTEAHRGEIWSTFLTCGLSKREAGNLYQHFYSLEKYRGARGLVSSLKQRFAALLNKNEDIFRRKGGLWRGPYKPLMKLKVVGGEKGLERALAILKLSGYYVAPEATLDDYEDARKRLLRNPDPFYGKAAFPFLSKDRDPDAIAYTSFPVTPSIWEASQDIAVKTSMAFPMSWRNAPIGIREYCPEIHTDDLDHLRSLEMFPRLVVEHYNYFKALIGPEIMPFQHFQNLKRRNEKQQLTDVAGGVVLLTKDRAMKLRLIANCNRMLQLACTPLHEYLKQVLHQHEGTHIFSQEDGVKWGVGRLSSGIRISSIDLTSASDNIPLSAQRKLCRNLFRNKQPILTESLEVFCEISRMEWFTPFEECTITWSNGSPMGVRGSYYLFTLFLVNLLDHVGGAGQYAIVGDDIIVESSLTDIVIDALTTLHIPISNAKSLFDNDLAEFCGRIIGSAGPLRVYKGAPLSLIDDPYGKLRQLGKKALHYFAGYRALNKRDKQILRYYHWAENQELWESVAVLDRQPDKLVLPPQGGLSVVQMIKRGDLQPKHYQLVLKLQHASSLRNDDNWKLYTDPITDTGADFKEFLSFITGFPATDLQCRYYAYLGRQSGYGSIRERLNVIAAPSRIDNFIINSNSLVDIKRAKAYLEAKENELSPRTLASYKAFGQPSIERLNYSAIDPDRTEPLDTFTEDDLIAAQIAGKELLPRHTLRKKGRAVKRAIRNAWTVTVVWLMARWPG